MSLARIFSSPKTPKSLRRLPSLPHRIWWGVIWRGLVVENAGKHYQAMGTGIWLYLYLVIHADRRTGGLQRRIATIAADMGIQARTIRRWLSVLRRQNYILTQSTGRALSIQIQRWKPLKKSRPRS